MANPEQFRGAWREIVKSETVERVYELQEAVDRARVSREEAVRAAQTAEDSVARLCEAEVPEEGSVLERELTAPRKEIYCFVGFPGAGKSTQIERLQEMTGAEVFHVGKLAKEIGARDEGKRATGQLLEGLDDIFLSRVLASSGESAILDGFPRSAAQADALYAFANRQGWRVSVLSLTFPEGEEVLRSFDRQVSRSRKGQEVVDEPRMVGKIARAIAEDMAAISRVRDLGGRITDIDGTKSVDEITDEIRENLGLDFESMDWESDTLDALADVSRETGIEAWAGSGLLYRPFWNGRFGPHQDSTDKDVFVQNKAEIAPFKRMLVQKYPQYRWSVHSRAEASKEHYGKEYTNVIDGMLNVPMNYRRGGVRVTDGKIDVTLAPGVERDLRNGILRLDETMLAAMMPEARERTLAEMPSRVRKTLEEYPGLQIAGVLKDIYEAQYGEHVPLQILREASEMEKSVEKAEKGGRAEWEGMTEQEAALADEVRRFYASADRRPSAPPRPTVAPLPEELEAVRRIKERIENGEPVEDSDAARLQGIDAIAAPEGFSSWLEYVSTQSDDGTFREWVLNQTRSRKPFGGKDPDLRDLMQYQPFLGDEEVSVDRRKGEQKVTHQGWELKLHLRETALQLGTDQLATTLEPVTFRRVRGAMRLTMLYHDIGKLLNVNTPGAHEGIGAKLFRKFKPAWVDDETAEMVEWMIKTHDVFGRLARGITEKPGKKVTDADFDVREMTTYKGALDPAAARRVLTASGLELKTATAIHKAIWQADVSSVSSLRWILPVADVLERIVVADSDKE